MKAADLVRVLGWLVRDTFRQSLASSAFWLILGLSVIAILFCLSVRTDRAPLYAPDDIGINPHRGQLQIGFGALSMPLFRDDRAAVLFLEVILGQWTAGTVGLLLALVWTAGFLPSFLEPSAATVLLAKPVPRSWLLLGKVLGVLAFMTFQMAVFFVGTWLALGLRTGIWAADYLLCLPLTVLQFLSFFSISVLIAVLTRSTVLCLFGSIAFWALCYAVNYCHHLLALNTGSGGSFQTMLVDAAYWVLPKPTDVVVLLHRTLEAGQHFTLTDELAAASFSPWLTLLTSAIFAAVMLGLAAWRLERTQY